MLLFWFVRLAFWEKLVENTAEISSRTQKIEFNFNLLNERKEFQLQATQITGCIYHQLQVVY